MLRSPSKNNMSNIGDLFTRDPKDKIPPDLRHALALLRLNNLEGLEERFLSTDAFLEPWSVFRDSILLLSPDVLSRATQIKGAGAGISRLDLLWFYTQFDEGTLRYDSRADKYSADYTPDTSIYGTIDKGNWRVEEYEKHLYAWLLQDFKVGKAYSPWRFECFELKNICTSWEDVFVPIVNAVRASYDRRGRRFYGRLALFIEAKCPSRLAFPDSNIGIPEGGVLSPTPYRVVSVPKNMVNGAGRMSYSQQENSNGVLSKKHYDETEKELRDVYPQYGGLVERPKFKHKMDEWLAEQRARADRRKAHERHGQVQSFQPQIVKRNGSRSPSKQLPKSPPGSFHKRHQRSTSGRGGEGSPIKQFSDSIKRSLSQTMSSIRPKEEQKSPLHGVTRQLHFPDRQSSQVDDSARSSMIITPLPRPDQQNRMLSEVSVYTSIRNSNPFTEDLPDDLKAQRARANTAGSVYSPVGQRARTDTDESVFSPMAQLSAIPRPLYPEPEARDNIEPMLKDHPAIRQRKSYRDVRVPSYEGTGYQEEISLTDLHNQRLKATRSPESTRSAKLATRLPAPIVPIPYNRPRVASADKRVYSPSKAATPLPQPGLSPSKPVVMPGKPVVSPPKPITMSQKPVVAAPKPVAWQGPSASKAQATAWPGTSPPKATAWPGFVSDDDDFPPSIPYKSLERQSTRVPGQLHNPRSRQLMREDGEHEMSRIVSRENIRAALGGISRESSTEELAPPKSFANSVRTMSPMRQQLQTYNTNMFPRKEENKGTLVGEWVRGEREKGRFDPGGAFELEVLNGGKREDKV